ncbi:MAG: hypothetical protein IIX58_02315 [Alistipes sp.]|nr:hypothetical protein [Alistipes sp.]
MKRYLMLLALLFVGMQAASAQTLTEGSLDVLRGQQSVKVIVDYSNAIIMDMTEAEFAEYEEDWYKDQPTIISDLIDEVNQRSGHLLYMSARRESDYTLRWSVRYIYESGDIVSDFYLESADGEVVAKIADVVGEGGAFGTKLYRIKSGAESTGRALGKFFKKELM